MISITGFQEMIGILRDAHAVNWMNVVERATHKVCTMFRDGPINSATKDFASMALAEAIFDCAKISPGYAWCPEDGEYRMPH